MILQDPFRVLYWIQHWPIFIPCTSVNLTIFMKSWHLYHLLFTAEFDSNTCNWKTSPRGCFCVSREWHLHRTVTIPSTYLGFQFHAISIQHVDTYTTTGVAVGTSFPLATFVRPTISTRATKRRNTFWSLWNPVAKVSKAWRLSSTKNRGYIHCLGITSWALQVNRSLISNGIPSNNISVMGLRAIP